MCSASLPPGLVDTRDVHGRTPLIVHAQEGNDDPVRLLLEKKADIAVADIDGITALMVAAANGHATTVDLLLSHGADPSPRDKRHYTALGMAVANGHAIELALLFKAHKADLEASSPVGGALATAAYHDQAAEIAPLPSRSRGRRASRARQLDRASRWPAFTATSIAWAS